MTLRRRNKKQETGVEESDGLRWRSSRFGNRKDEIVAFLTSKFPFYSRFLV